jgi:fibronectin-binding autotransporter adhesin
MKRYRAIPSMLASLITLAALLAAPAAFAATYTWDGGAATTNMSTAANWNPDGTPTDGGGDTCRWDSTVSGDLALIWGGNFGGSPTGVTIYVASTHTGSLNLDAASGNLFLRDITIEADAGAFSLGNGVGTAPVTLRNTPGGTPGGFHQWLNNSTNAAALGSDLTWASGSGIGRIVAFDGTGDWIVNTVLGPTGGGFGLSLIKSGTGKLTLTATNNYSGTTTISNGLVQITGSGKLGVGSTLTMAGGALNLGGTSQTVGNTLTISAPAASGSTISNGTLSSSNLTASATNGNAIVSADLSLSGTLTKTGDGLLTLAGANDSIANATLIAGNVVVDSPGTVRITNVSYAAAGSRLTVSNGTLAVTSVVSSANSAFRNLDLNGGVLLSAGNLFSDGLAPSVSFNGGTLKSDNAAGIAVYDNDGSIAVSAGGATMDTVVGNITTTNILAGSSGGAITVRGGNTFQSPINNNGVLDLQDASTWDFNGVASTVGGLSGTNGTIANSGSAAALTVNIATTQSFGGTFAAASPISLTKSGAGKQTLTGSNGYTGGTAINNGILALGGSGTLGSTTSALALGGGALDLGATSQTVGDASLSAAATSGDTIGNGSLSVASLIANNGSGTAVVSANVTSSWYLNKSGAGALTLSGNNSFTQTNNFPNTGAITVGGGIVTLSGNNAFTSTQTQGGNTVAAVGGTLVLTGTNTVTSPNQDGAIVVAFGGTLILDSFADNLGGATRINLGASSGSTTNTLRYTGTGETTALTFGSTAGGTNAQGIIEQAGTGLLKITGNYVPNGATLLTLQGGTGGTGEYAGNIGNSVNTTALAKLGTGTWTLSGTNAYAGTTTVSGGTLIVNGINGTGAVTVASTATLGGSGVINGPVSLEGTLAPGASAGTLTISNTLTMSSTAVLDYELGTASDVTIVSGDLTLDGTLNVTNNGGFAAGVYPIVKYGGTLTDNTLDVGSLPGGLSGSISNDVDSTPKQIVLIVSGGAPTGYDAYIQAVTNGLTGYQDDADQDGYPNLLEYATGGNPTNSDTVARMDVGRTNAILQLKFTRNTNAVDVTMIVEGSSSLVNGATWTGVATNSSGAWVGDVTETGTDPKHVTANDTGSGTQRNLRLKVTRP